MLLYTCPAVFLLTQIVKIMYIPPKNNPEFSQMRLNGILGRRRLIFNPYTVSDRRLLEIAETTNWGNDFDITQIVIMHFTRLRETGDFRKYDGIFMRLGRTPEEVFISSAALAYGVTANDTIRLERTWVGMKPLRHKEEVASLAGRSVFVSRIVRGVNNYGHPKAAYRMHKLTGKIEKDAQIIREAMCNAKIEMLQRIFDYPQSPDYLSCNKGVIDYESRLWRAIEIIRHYPETPIPQD